MGVSRYYIILLVAAIVSMQWVDLVSIFIIIIARYLQEIEIYMPKSYLTHNYVTSEVI